jgi:hypothetical protein
MYHFGMLSRTGKNKRAISEIVRCEVDPDNLLPPTDKQKAALWTLFEIPDSAIDYSDIPPLYDAFWKNAVRNQFYKQKKAATCFTGAEDCAVRPSCGK